ncbi:hypothetical protein LZG04_15440 [Saccharothrix sp. S26]|uniref:hypothetical protein n=1 Tax=Saccharothrix sp. S26 TaxID=2907215 RepID=UPI001F352A9E|nr:hypothetical protein [Saccharothrix sp. S26]MCE6996186.1 hypothetical protein [Saccharothrix sp. S26]
MNVRRTTASILTAGALAALVVAPVSAATPVPERVPAADRVSVTAPPAGCATAIAAAVDSANAATAAAANVADSAAAAAAAKAFEEGVLTGTPAAINAAAANLAAFSAAAATAAAASAAAYATSAGATVAVLVACAQA